jgi:hypothetical protein
MSLHFQQFGQMSCFFRKILAWHGLYKKEYVVREAYYIFLKDPCETMSGVLSVLGQLQITVVCVISSV